MGLPRCGVGYVDDNVGRYACEIVSTREISSSADQRTCIPRRGTYDLNTDKGEVGGSSPPRPTSKYEKNWFPRLGMALVQLSRLLHERNLARSHSGHSALLLP